MDLTDTIIPKSDQLNAEDLLSGPRTVTITEVHKGASAEQPVDIVLNEFGPGRPFKPSKTVRRILVLAWGPDAATYTGRRMTIYRDPAVKFGGMDVGGIRISHLSHIDKPLTVALAVSKGKRAAHTVKPLAEEPSAAAKQRPSQRDLFIFRAKNVSTLAEWREVWQAAKDAGLLDEALKAELTSYGEALKAPAREPAPDPSPAEQAVIDRFGIFDEPTT